MEIARWKKLAAVALLTTACGPGSDGAGTGGGGASGAGGAGTGGAGAGGEAGATGDGGGGAAGGEAQYACASLGDPCSTCLALSCQESYCACREDPECSALANCLLGCSAGDDGCHQACLTAHAAGISGIFLEDGCASEHCMPQCPSRAAPPLSTCEACRFARCAGEMNTCFAAPACREAVTCAAACGAGDEACRGACVAELQDGGAAARAVFACEEARCRGACEGG